MFLLLGIGAASKMGVWVIGHLPLVSQGWSGYLRSNKTSLNRLFYSHINICNQKTWLWLTPWYMRQGITVKSWNSILHWCIWFCSCWSATFVIFMVFNCVSSIFKIFYSRFNFQSQCLKSIQGKDFKIILSLFKKNKMNIFIQFQNQFQIKNKAPIKLLISNFINFIFEFRAILFKKIKL